MYVFWLQIWLFIQLHVYFSVCVCVWMPWMYLDEQMRQMVQSAKGWVLTPVVASTKGSKVTTCYLSKVTDNQLVTVHKPLTKPNASIWSFCPSSICGSIGKKKEIITLSSEGLRLQVVVGLLVLCSQWASGLFCQLEPLLLLFICLLFYDIL